MAYFRIDHRKVYFNEVGNGEPILLLPGNSASSKMFQSIVEMFAQDFRVILIDFPGHGKSERVEKFEADLKMKNDGLDFHIFETGGHPAMLSNKDLFYDLVIKMLRGRH